MNMAILEHKRETSSSIKVKSKFCSYFLSYRMVDILRLSEKLLKNTLSNSELQKKYI